MKPNLLIAFPIIFSFLLIPISWALITGNLIENGDFQDFDETEMSTNGFDEFPFPDWTSTIFTGADCDEFPADFCRIQNETFCQSLNFTDNCFQWSGDAGIQQRSISSNVFIWEENRTSANLRLYHFSINDGAVRLISTDGLTSFSTASFSSSNEVQSKTINVTNLTQGDSFRIELDLNCGVGGCDHFIDNITFGLSELFVTTLVGNCNIKFLDTPDQFVNQSFSCETSPIDTRECIAIGDVSGQIRDTYYNESLKCLENQGVFPFEYEFNVSSTRQDSQSFCILGTMVRTSGLFILPFHVFAEPNSNSDKYLNNSGAFSTCTYDYNNTNVSIQQMECRLRIECGLNLSTNRNCDSICRDGTLFENGTFSDILGQCVFDQNSIKSKCLIGCGTPTSCAELIIFNETIGEPFQTQNITSPFLKGFVELFVSPHGIFLIVLYLVSITACILLNERIGIYVIIIMSFMFAILTWIPTWIGFLSAAFGITLTVLREREID